MQISPDQCRQYLQRIGFGGPTEPDLATLRRLQRQHMLSVPFENLSIHLGEPIVLDIDRLFDKIVGRQRGGFCYELNGLFFALLRSLGFEGRMISARVYNREKDRFGPEFDHLALIIEIEEEGSYLVDVGFGRFAMMPLQLAIGHDQRDGSFVYRIVRHSPTHFKVMHSDRGMPYDDDYLFSLLGQDLEDFEEQCRFHQTSPESSFTQKRVCSLATPEGRISLSDTQLTITRLGRKEEIAVSDEDDFGRKLETYFGIRL